MPGSVACLGVALGLGCMIYALLAPSPAWLRLAIASVFVARGALGFFEPWLRRELVGTRYAVYRRFVYTPLALSVGFAILIAG